MDISALTGSASSASTASAAQQAAKQTMGKQDFLQLLVAQLKAQDPMSPMKGQEFAAQLAQFSSLEQLMNINDTLGGQADTNGLLAQRINSSLAADMLGKTVQATGNTIQWDGDGEVPLQFDLASPATEVSVSIRDAAGNPVFKQDMGGLNSGYHELAWDGKDADGNTLPRGVYTFSVAAADGNGTGVNVTPFQLGSVDRVTFGENGTTLWVNGQQIPMSQVQSIQND